MFTDSTIIKPDVGKFVVLVKDIVVSLAVLAALNVVCNCKASTDTPPTGNLTSLNLTDHHL